MINSGLSRHYSKLNTITLITHSIYCNTRVENIILKNPIEQHLRDCCNFNFINYKIFGDLNEEHRPATMDIWSFSRVVHRPKVVTNWSFGM
jgi:hypothetical protein